MQAVQSLKQLQHADAHTTSFRRCVNWRVLCAHETLHSAGFEGFKGFKRFKGFEGFKGSKGFEGFKGSKGFKRFKGSKGFKGFRAHPRKEAKDDGVSELPLPASLPRVQSFREQWGVYGVFFDLARALNFVYLNLLFV